jgi:hypothetical protein
MKFHVVTTCLLRAQLSLQHSLAELVVVLAIIVLWYLDCCLLHESRLAQSNVARIISGSWELRLCSFPTGAATSDPVLNQIDWRQLEIGQSGQPTMRDGRGSA